MYNTAESIRILAIILSPFMPETSQKIWEQLGIKEAMESKGLKDLKWGGLEAKTAVRIGKQLFPRIEEKTKEEKTGKKVTEKEMESHATIEDLSKLNLRAGRIVQAEKVEKSKKLLKLQVDLGKETRTVVAGIAEHYSPDEIIGKNIILVANLKPATIMGVESQGMVLAGNTDGKIILGTFDKEVDPGSAVS
jgi:methionyl-tRNA synthetase